MAKHIMKGFDSLLPYKSALSIFKGEKWVYPDSIQLPLDSAGGKISSGEIISITMRKLKKCYPITPNIVFALSDKFNDLYPYIMENLVLMKIKTDYFYRNNYEVDFIEVHEKKIKAIEIKKTDREMKQLKLFTKKYKNVEPLMVTYNREKHDDIDVMPLWVFLLQ